MSCSIWSRANSYTHDNMIAIRDAAAVRRELVDSKRVIEDLFGREVIGFTAPGGFGHGFLGETRLLDALWEAGYRYVRTLSWQPNHVAPASPWPRATTCTGTWWRNPNSPTRHRSSHRRLHLVDIQSLTFG